MVVWNRRNEKGGQEQSGGLAGTASDGICQHFSHPRCCVMVTVIEYVLWLGIVLRVFRAVSHVITSTAPWNTISCHHVRILFWSWFAFPSQTSLSCLHTLGKSKVFLLQENIGEIQGNYFLNKTLIVQEIRTRIDRCGCIRLKIFYTSKETMTRMKKQTTE